MSEKIIRRLMYIGVRRGTRQKRLYVWYMLTDAEANNGKRIELDESRLMCFPKNLKRAEPGAIFEFLVEIKAEGKSVDTGSGKYLEMWKHSAQVHEWQIESDSTEATMASESQAIKDMKDKSVWKALDPIREMYEQAGNKCRAQILALVIEHITRDSPL